MTESKVFATNGVQTESKKKELTSSSNAIHDFTLCTICHQIFDAEIISMRCCDCTSKDDFSNHVYYCPTCAEQYLKRCTDYGRDFCTKCAEKELFHCTCEKDFCNVDGLGGCAGAHTLYDEELTDLLLEWASQPGHESM